MTFSTDLTMWRVYSAEQSIPQGQVFETIEEARTYLWWVTSTSWWKHNFPNAPTITVNIGGRSDSDELISFAEQIRSGEWHISLHHRMMTAVVLLHEIAHCVTPRAYGSLEKIRRGYIGIAYHHRHGDMFTGALSALVKRYKPDTDADELSKAYEHYGVPVASLEEVIAARAFSDLIVAANDEQEERSRVEIEADPRYLALREALAERERSGFTASAPAIGWGEWIFRSRRRNRPKVTQQALADAISPLVASTRRDVARMEALESPPQSLRDRRIVLALAAVLQIDPVWAETHLGLAPSTETLTADALNQIAEPWITAIRQLDALVDTRPPIWDAPADR